MKRRHLFILALAASAAGMVFANGALAGTMSFNPTNGEFSYKTGSVAYDDYGKPAGLNDSVKVFSTGIGSVPFAIQPRGWRFGSSGPDANVFKYCSFIDDYGWSCPAKKVMITTGAGSDTITVNYNVKVPTVLQGGAGTDIIYGGGGPDVIFGGCISNPTCDVSANSLHGGDGNDTLHGGNAAFDYVAGDAGDDVLDGGGLGRDNLYGGDGRDTADYSKRTAAIVASLDGTANDGEPGENDYIATDVEAIQGGSGKDTLYAGFLINSILKGGPGDDTLIGYAGNDLLMGEAGYDQLRPGNGHDNVYGGDAQDTVSYAERLNPVTVTLDGVANDGETGENDFVASDVENVLGGKSNDTLTGNGQANKLFGGPGNDTLEGNGGQPDELYGEAGNDKLHGGPVNSYYDVLDGGADTDGVSYAYRTDPVTIMLGISSEPDLDKIANVENAIGGSGDDKIVGTDGPNALFGGGGYDRIQGNGGNDSLFGGDGNDVLWGNAGNDQLWGNVGDDTLSGGAGADLMNGYLGFDTVTYVDYTVPVTVTLDGSANDGAAGEGDNVYGDVEVVIGGRSGDTLTGNDLANWIYGGGGPDKLFGLGGNDMLDGQAGTDTVNGGADTDTCLAETRTSCEN